MGVDSLLCCVCWEAAACGASAALGPGGMYVCPYDGVKIGRGDATFMSLVSDVTAESCII